MTGMVFSPVHAAPVLSFDFSNFSQFFFLDELLQRHQKVAKLTPDSWLRRRDFKCILGQSQMPLTTPKGRGFLISLKQVTRLRAT